MAVRNVLLAAGLTWGITAAAGAQVVLGVPAPSPQPRPAATSPRPEPVPTPAPSSPTRAGTRWRQEGVPSSVPGTQLPADLFRAGPDTYAPRYGEPGRPHRWRRSPRTSGYAYPSGMGASYLGFPDIERHRPQHRDAGYLRLQTSPITAGVYIDGVYAGMAHEIAHDVRGYVLPTGPHRVELVAPGFERRLVEVRIDAGRDITLRTELTPVPAPGRGAGSAPASGQAPPVRSTPVPPLSREPLYVIPRCYAGNRPPIREQLPAGCDVTALRVVPAAAPAFPPDGEASPARGDRP